MEKVRALYAERLADRRAAAERAGSRARWISNTRLVGFALGARAALARVRDGLALEAVARPGGASASSRWCSGTSARGGRTRRAERGAEFYARGLARLDLSDAPWGNTGERHLDPEHPYAMHLDLFGRRSLFELLSQAQTQRGEERLAEWLLAPAAADEVRARQAAVAELRPRLALREDLFALGRELGDSMPADPLIAWATAPRAPRRLARCAPRAAALSGVTVARDLARARGLDQLGAGARPGPARGRGSRRAAAPSRERARRDRAARCATSTGSRRCSRASRPSPARRRACARPAPRSTTRACPPRARSRSYTGWWRSSTGAATSSSRRSRGLLLWGLQIACALEAWRARSGGDIAGWLDAVGDFEALGDLAGYAFEHPADPFPELADTGPLFHARGARSPAAARLALRAQRPRRSTPRTRSSSSRARTCRARARSCAASARPRSWRSRARRCARSSLRLSPLALGACLRVQDSLRDGASRFYAELLSLRRVAERCKGPLPVLFLLDEILNGTNSHDRRIGADALLQGTARARRDRARDDPRPRADRDRGRARAARDATPTSRTSSRTASCASTTGCDRG